MDLATIPSSGLWSAIAGLLNGNFAKVGQPIELSNTNLLNLNHPDWGNQEAGTYFLVGIGSAWSNLPSDGAHQYTFLGASTYTAFIVVTINTPSAWSQSFAFTSDTDFGNADLARQSRRAASNFGAAAAVGWRIEALTRD